MFEKCTKELLYQFRIGPQYRGFHYFISAVPILNQHPDYLGSITKCLYPEIAKIHKTSPACVERDLRTVISILWKNGCGELFDRQHILSSPHPWTGRRPTNTQFFELLMAYLETAAALAPAAPAAAPDRSEDSGAAALPCDTGTVHSAAIIHTDQPAVTFSAPRTCKNCPVIASLNEKIATLEKENRWMHDLICQMISEKQS